MGHPVPFHVRKHLTRASSYSSSCSIMLMNLPTEQCGFNDLHIYMAGGGLDLKIEVCNILVEESVG